MRVALVVIGYLSVLMCVLSIIGLLFVGQVVVDSERIDSELNPFTFMTLLLQTGFAVVLFIAANGAFASYGGRLRAAGGLLIFVSLCTILSFNLNSSTEASSVMSIYIASGLITTLFAGFVSWACLTAAHER